METLMVGIGALLVQCGALLMAVAAFRDAPPQPLLRHALAATLVGAALLVAASIYPAAT